MKKAILFLLILASLALCACSGGGKEKEALPSPAALAAELLASGAYSEALEPADGDVGCFLYALQESDAPGMVFYFSGGSTAEEIAVFPCADEAALTRVQAECGTRLELQIRLFADYKPEEVPKLEGALVLTRDNTVILCVAADYDKARAVLDRYF